MPPLRNIVCPTDFSEGSEAALELAVELATRSGGSIELLHVFQPPVYAGLEDGPAAMATTTQFIEQARKRADGLLEALRVSHAGKGVTFTTHHVDGIAHQVIAERSKLADLIVMGTHGRTGFAHLMLGSVAERVVRTAHCPVLTVPVKH